MPLISHSSLSKPLREILIDKTRSKAGGGRLRLYLNWRATMYDWDAWKCHGTCLTSGSMYVAAAVATKRKRPTMLYLVFYLRTFCQVPSLKTSNNFLLFTFIEYLSLGSLYSILFKQIVLQRATRDVFCIFLQKFWIKDTNALRTLVRHWNNRKGIK